MKNITKKNMQNLESIALHAEKLNVRISKLYEETRNFNYRLNYLAILHHADKLSRLLNADFNAFKE